MLQSLYISNFLLVDAVGLDFRQGLTALTGETGAGKSIILDALLLVLGGRIGGKVAKDPSRPTTISASFSVIGMHALHARLEAHGIENGDVLLLRRVVSGDGKSKAYINDIPASVSLLASLKGELLEICGQHDSHGLLDPGSHLNLLDNFGGYIGELEGLAALYSEYSLLNKELLVLRDKSASAAFEAQYLQESIDELQAFDPEPDEETQLVDRRKLVMESTKVQDALDKAREAVDDAWMKRLYTLERELARFSEIFHEPLNMIRTATIELQEALTVLNAFGPRLYHDDGSLGEIEDRLSKLRAMARKYMTTPAQLPELLIQKQAELNNFTTLDETIAEKGKRLAEVAGKYSQLARWVSERRYLAADKLRVAMLAELQDLKMDKAGFKVEVVTAREGQGWGVKGIDSVRFLVCPNPGSPYGQLDKIASGGELSRIMLALKAAMANVRSVPLLIFDEIDTGISGAVSDAVGRKLAVLATRYQVVVVTHQPQVAVYGHSHLLVRKQSTANDTKVQVSELDAQGRKEEIARMLSGEALTDESLAAAGSLIQSAA